MLRALLSEVLGYYCPNTHTSRQVMLMAYQSAVTSESVLYQTINGHIWMLMVYKWKYGFVHMYTSTGVYMVCVHVTI